MRERETGGISLNSLVTFASHNSRPRASSRFPVVASPVFLFAHPSEASLPFFLGPALRYPIRHLNKTNPPLPPSLPSPKFTFHLIPVGTHKRWPNRNPSRRPRWQRRRRRRRFGGRVGRRRAARDEQQQDERREAHGPSCHRRRGEAMPIVGDGPWRLSRGEAAARRRAPAITCAVEPQ